MVGAGLRQGDRPEDAERPGADVAGGFLHAPVDGLEGGDRDPDHEEQRAHELDQHHAPEGGDEIEAEEDPAMATSRPNFGKAWPARKEKKRRLRPGKSSRAKAKAAGRQIATESSVTMVDEAEADADRGPDVVARQRRVPELQAELLRDDRRVAPDVGEGPGADDEQREDDDEGQRHGEGDAGPVDALTDGDGGANSGPSLIAGDRADVEEPERRCRRRR